jgi:hypothetical protein
MNNRAKKLTNLVGWIFLALFVHDVIYAKMFNNGVLYCSKIIVPIIAIGLFTRWQWARILGIGYALLRSVTFVIVMLGLFFSLENYTGTFSSKVFPQQYVYPIGGMFALFFWFLVYVLFRPDVRELFGKKNPDIVSEPMSKEN